MLSLALLECENYSLHENKTLLTDGICLTIFLDYNYCSE